MPMTTAVCDTVLVQEFRASRSEDAFAQLVSRHGELVYRTCLRLLGNRSDAEDAAQAVFLVLAQRCGSVKGPLVPWLLGVSRRVSLKLLVGRARRERREKAAARTDRTPDLPVPGLREELDAALAALPAPLAEAVSLRYLEGRSQQDAAEISGCPQGTLGRRAMEGLDRLRAILGRRGVVVAPALLMGYLAQQQSLAVPATLAGKLTLAAAGKAAVSASACALAEATAKAALLAKLKLAAAVVLAAVVGAGTVVALRPASVETSEARMLVNFDGAAPPLNQAGEGYPQSFYEPGRADPGCRFMASIEPADAVAGHSLRMRVSAGRFKANFMPEGPGGHSKVFARDYTVDPAQWRFDTYNRLRFWIKLPRTSPPHSTSGGSNMTLGSYVKGVAGADEHSLDAGGGSYHHRFNAPALEQWTQVVFNMHPNVRLGGDENRDLANLPHPTGEPGFNYFDALTQFYIEARDVPSKYPADYLLDEIEFYREPRPENDDQVYSIAATHVPAEGRIILTWNRRFGEDTIAHEVRYAFEDIHRLGWEQAAAAPGGIIRPSGRGSQTAMIYDTRALPLAGRKVVYLAIKPQNADGFSQVAVPLTLK